MTLSGLVDLFCTEPTIVRTIEDARGGRQQVLDLTSPPPMRPLIAAALAATNAARGRRSPGAGRHVDLPRGRGGDRGAGVADRRGRGRLLPGLGDPAARAAQPALGHRRPPAGRAPPAGRSRRRDRRRRSSWPRSAACCSRRSRAGRPDAGPAGRRRGLRSRRPGRRPGRRRVRPGRPGRAARRVRRPRRHRRHLPAHRGAPGPGRLLRRHGRGDPLLLGRRPAIQRPVADRDHRLALPRAAADRRGTRRGRRRSPSSTPS